MQRTLTTEITAHVGERVRIAGWLHSLRLLGSINFLVLRDGWGLVQAVAETEAEMAPLSECHGNAERFKVAGFRDAPVIARRFAPDLTLRLLYTEKGKNRQRSP